MSFLDMLKDGNGLIGPRYQPIMRPNKSGTIQWFVFDRLENKVIGRNKSVVAAAMRCNKLNREDQGNAG